MQSLRDEVQEVIRPYTTAEEPPPFSGGELIVMALVDTDEDTLPKDRILRWVVKTFKYYHDAFIDIALRNLSPDLDFRDGWGRGVFENITRAFTEYDLPIYESRMMLKKRNTVLCSVTTQAARVYLRRWLEPERKGTFQFLDLPPEIRNTIYELLFTFPSSGIHVQESENDGEGSEVYFLQRIDQPGSSLERWSDSRVNGNPSMIKKSMEEILALFYVNRQVYKEAMPFFYMLNTFHFDHYSIELERFALSMPRSRFEHTRKLHLDLTGGIEEWLIESWPEITLGLSTKAVGFAELTISMTDDAWLSRGSKARQLRKSGARTSRYSCIDEMPGFPDLAVVVARAEDVRWEGACSEIRLFIDMETEMIEAADHETERETGED